jgi:hypothetical protein
MRAIVGSHDSGGLGEGALCDTPYSYREIYCDLC